MHLRLIAVAIVNYRDAFCEDFSPSNTKVLNLLSSSPLICSGSFCFSNFSSSCWICFACSYFNQEDLTDKTNAFFLRKESDFENYPLNIGNFGKLP